MTTKDTKVIIYTIVVITGLLALLFICNNPDDVDAYTGYDYDRCGTHKKTNNYVKPPTVSSSGKVTHSLKDRFGNSYASGSYVKGYYVRVARGNWVYRSGSSTTITSGQVAKACIAQKAYTSTTWNVLSPYVYKP